MICHVHGDITMGLHRIRVPRLLLCSAVRIRISLSVHSNLTSATVPVISSEHPLYLETLELEKIL